MSVNESVWGFLSRLSAIPGKGMAPVPRLYSYELLNKEMVWEVQAQGSIGKVAAMALLPQRNQGPNDAFCNRSLRAALRLLPDDIVGSAKKIEIKENGIEFTCLILYPKQYDHSNKTKCVLYNNPNGVTVEELLRDGLDPRSTPYKIFCKTVCPMILYDYRGTGINQDGTWPSVNSVTLDGVSALAFAANEFEQVDVWGSSLGGAVAAIATDAYLNERPHKTDKFRVYSLDSYTSTKAVVLPPHLVHFPGLKSDSFDAETSVKSLVERNVKVVVLCHLADPIIKLGARLFDKMSGKCELISSPNYGHGNLTDDMLQKLS